ncbi:hypothetical protein [Paludisphaera mucosa]|uniref:Uncharacterized protein n=1 Tax=Paludisphaera mucosa TaxID=3030827 RepID=A0ABT6FA66_9BACT|nr:hypothetical protein [Paludisphaera mucosa]MDG3004412.1 hypothetical protein [Paludisphaera mucosa]
MKASRGRGFIVGSVALLAACVLATVCFMRSGRRPLHPSARPLPLSASPFLRDVVEPIAIVQALPFSDGGSVGVQYRDARGVERSFCLVSFALDFDDPPRPSEVAFGSVFPSRVTTPVGSDDERALLGLLERWAAADPEGRELDRQSHRISRREISYGDLSADAGFKLVVRSILRKLRARNEK